MAFNIDTLLEHRRVFLISLAENSRDYWLKTEQEYRENKMGLALPIQSMAIRGAKKHKKRAIDEIKRLKEMTELSMDKLSYAPLREKA